MPPKKMPKMTAIIANVLAAFLRFGSLKFGTALLMASTPVREDEPAEKAFKNKIIVMPGTA